MAEHVQAALDQMVAPLRDLMDRKIFSESEIRAIVTRRRESEYLLRRMVARKADLLRYIEAEQTLERLRQLRTLQRKRDHRKSRQNENDDLDAIDKDDNGKEIAKKEEQHIGDVHIIQHVHLLFVRAIRKFRSDLSLHLQHAEWCKQQKSWTRLGRVYAEALQIFPRQAGLWIEAASHEFFGPATSIRNARVLLQRGIRLNNQSEELWVEYFSLELHYAQTLKGRRQILQPSECDPTSSVETAKEEYKVAAIIFRNAIRAIPNSVQFRLRFMDACKRFPTTDLLMESIQESMKKDFASEPESWIARALYEAERRRTSCSKQSQTKRGNIGDDADEEEENTADVNRMERPSKKARKVPDDSVIVVLREAIKNLPTEEMFLQSFRFVQNYRKELEHGDADRGSVEAIERFIEHLWKAAGDYISIDLALEHCQYLLNCGQASKAVETIKAYCTSSCGKKLVPAKAWILWAALAPSKNQKGILERALQTLSMDHPDYVEVLLQHFGAQIADDEADAQLFDTLQQILLLAPKTTADIQVVDTGLEFGISSVFEAYYTYLKHSLTKRGIEGARKVYSGVLFQSTVQLTENNVENVKSFVDLCLDVEQGSGGDRKRLRRLYDKALEIFGGTSLEDKYRQDRNDRSVYA